MGSEDRTGDAREGLEDLGLGVEEESDKVKEEWNDRHEEDLLERQYPKPKDKTLLPRQVKIPELAKFSRDILTKYRKLESELYRSRPCVERLSGDENKRDVTIIRERAANIPRQIISGAYNLIVQYSPVRKLVEAACFGYALATEDLFPSGSCFGR